MADGYAGWSLAELKSAAAAVDASTLDREANTLRNGAARLDTVVRQFDSAVARLADNWAGTAANAAATNARATIGTASDTSTIATDVTESVTSYADAVRRTQHEVAAIPDERFSWARALAGGGWGGPIGIGVAAFGQHQEAERHRAHAVELVTELDAEGHAHADDTRAQPWAMGMALSEPPTPLPAADVGHTSSPRTGRPTHALAQSAAADHRNESSPAHSGTKHDVAARAETATHRHHTRPRNAHDIDAHPVPVATTTLPAMTATRDTHDARDTRDTARADIDADPSEASTTRVAAVERTAAIESGAGGVAAGLGHDAVRQPRGEDGGRGTSSVPEPSPVSGSRETVVRGQSAPLATAQRPPGPVPGGTPGYPVGGSGRRRDDEDELRERPEFLIEPDYIWGDGRTAVPPVLG